MILCVVYPFSSLSFLFIFIMALVEAQCSGHRLRQQVDGDDNTLILRGSAQKKFGQNNWAERSKK